MHLVLLHNAEELLGYESSSWPCRQSTRYMRLQSKLVAAQDILLYMEALCCLIASINLLFVRRPAGPLQGASHAAHEQHCSTSFASQHIHSDMVLCRLR